MSQKNIIICIASTILAGVMISVALQHLKTQRDREREALETVIENPFYDEYRAVGSRYGLSMDFTRKASCVKNTQLEIEQIPLLGFGPKSCDILLVGDSSMAWGMVPEIVEQMTGLKMGVFSSEALFLNVPIARLIDNLASYYLKENGLLIISFGGWTQEQNANSMVLVYSDWIYSVAGMNNSEFAAYIDNWKKERAGGTDYAGLVRKLSFSRYRNSIKELRSLLENKYGMKLLQVSLYNDYFEPFINPKWHKQKIDMKAKMKCYLRWNNRSIVMYSTDVGKRSKYSEMPPDSSYKNKNIEIVSSILKKIPRRKAYQIHINFDDSKYSRLRSIYAAYYKGSFGLIDLGLEHPKNESYNVDEKEHTINTGGFYQSILMGRFLKSNFSALGKQ